MGDCFREAGLGRRTAGLWRAALGGLLLACLGAMNSPVALADSVPASATVTITDGGFNASSVTVEAGGSVTWTNGGRMVHTATALGGAFNSGGLGPGQSKSIKLSQPGTIQYTSATDCQNGNHPASFNCSAVVVVVAGGAVATPSASATSDRFGDVARQLLASLGNGSPDGSQVQAVVNWMAGEKPAPGQADAYSNNPLNVSRGALRWIGYSGDYSLPAPNAQPSNPIVQFPSIGDGISATAQFIRDKAAPIAALLTSRNTISQVQLLQAVHDFRWGTSSFGALGLDAPWVTPAPTETSSPSTPAFQPFWVQSYMPAKLWSGSDAKAVAFGPLPLWSFMQVLAPAADARFLVRMASSGAVAYVDQSSVGPTGPPNAASSSAGTVPASASAGMTPEGAVPPAWVQNYLPAQIWSGSDASAVAFGPLPLWSYLQVLGPASGSRLFVRVAATDSVAYVDRAAVGPSGPPPAVSPSQPAPAVASPAPGPAASRSVTVAPGDTLSGIAARFGTTVQTLVRLNGLPSADSILAGQTLRTPGGL